MRNVWLASYPKSGNTWFRILLANLTATSDTPADINALPRHCYIASSREPFDNITLLDSSLMTDDEINGLRPLVHEHLAGAGPDDDDSESNCLPVQFIKTHDAYSCTSSGEPLLAGRRGADGAIVIVRDPRDVAASLANHQGCSIDETIAFMNDTNAALCGKPDRQHSQFRQLLQGWSAHVESWLSQRDIPVHLVRYEDLKADTVTALGDALGFAQIGAGADAIDRAVRLADFAGLQEQERDKGFREAQRWPKDRKFFRRGEAGSWRDELTTEQIARIETEHAPMMRRLGYELSSPESTTATTLARAG